MDTLRGIGGDATPADNTPPSCRAGGLCDKAYRALKETFEQQPATRSQDWL